MRASRGKGRLSGRLLLALGAAVLAGAAFGAAAFAVDLKAPQGPLRLVPPTAPAPGQALPERPGALEPRAGPPTAVAMPRAPSIEVNPLGEIAPESIGTLDPNNGGFGVEMWRGSERAVVARLLGRLPDDMASRAMRRLARRLLMSIASPPSRQVAVSDPQAKSLLSLRVERLAALGEIPSLNDLLAVVPSRYDDERMARTRVDGLLLAHDMDEACRLVRNGIATYHAVPYWQKAFVLCQTVAGETDRAMLSLDLLREQGAEDDPLFFALAGATLGVEAVIPPNSELSPLHFAMLRAAGAPLPSGLVERAPPALLAAIAAAPNADLEQRARAAESACVKGLLDGKALAALYDAFTFAPEELTNAISAVASLEGPRARALLYQTARDQTLPATRAEVLDIAFERAARAGVYQAVVPVFMPLLSEIPAEPELAWFAPTAGRALYAAGRYEQASAWLMLGRQEALLNPQASGAVAALWPYSRLAGGAALTTEGNLAAWRAMREGMGDDSLGRRQTLLRATFQALGERDPLPWSSIAASGEPMARPLPNAALFYALEDASESRRIGETVLLSLIVIGERGPAESHTIALSAVLSALGRVGLETEARALAIEAALASGV